MCRKYIVLLFVMSFSFGQISNNTWGTDFYQDDGSVITGNQDSIFDFSILAEYQPENEIAFMCLDNSLESNLTLDSLRSSSTAYPIRMKTTGEIYDTESDLNLKVTISDNISTSFSDVTATPGTGLGYFGGTLTLSGAGVRDIDGNGIADYIENLPSPSSISPNLTTPVADVITGTNILFSDDAYLLGAFDLSITNNVDSYDYIFYDNHEITLTEYGHSVSEVTNNTAMNIEVEDINDINDAACIYDTSFDFIKVTFNNHVLDYVSAELNDTTTSTSMCLNDGLLCALQVDFTIKLAFEDV